MAKKTTYAYTPDYVIPPGETLEETMQAHGMTQQELAERTDLTVQTLNRIFKGEQPISYETATKLEYVTPYPASFWNNLEAQYRGQLAKQAEAESLSKNLCWLKTLPIKELVERKTLPATADKIVQLRESLKFFGVSSVEAWQNVWNAPAAAARRSTFFESNPGPTAAWLRLGQIEAGKIECAPYDKKCFESSLHAIRKLTTSDPEQFWPEMRSLCAKAGVALTLVPAFKKAPWSGAAEWLTPVKAMIQLCLRGKTEDKFWFTFFHEASHILHDGKKESFLDSNGSDDYAHDPSEKRADEFAAQMLIAPEHNVGIATIQASADVYYWAEKLDISPGIVAGRYQYLTRKWNFFNDIKRRFQWVPDDAE